MVSEINQGSDNDNMHLDISLSVFSCNLSTRFCKDCSSTSSGLNSARFGFIFDVVSFLSFPSDVVDSFEAGAVVDSAAGSSKASWTTFFGCDVVANPRATGFSCVFFFFGGMLKVCGSLHVERMR